MAHPDPQAAFGLFWRDAQLLLRREHGGRSLALLKKVEPQSGATHWLVSIGKGDRFEGTLALHPPKSRPRLSGSLVDDQLNAYTIRLDSFTGEGDELLEFAVSLLDMNYSFPADLGVEMVGFEFAGDKPRRP